MLKENHPNPPLLHSGEMGKDTLEMKSGACNSYIANGVHLRSKIMPILLLKPPILDNKLGHTASMEDICLNCTHPEGLLGLKALLSSTVFSQRKNPSSKIEPLGIVIHTNTCNKSHAPLAPDQNIQKKVG